MRVSKGNRSAGPPPRSSLIRYAGCVTRPHMTDGEWEFIEPFLPIGRYGSYPERLRQQFEGAILRRARLGTGMATA